MPESSSQAGPPEPSQYHHFIPRFLLRNFAVFKNPGRSVPKTSQKSKNRAPKPQKLAIIDLQSGDFKQGDVGDTFGIVDMYRDFEDADRDQHKLEKKLSVLESDAGVIIARVKQLYDAGKKEVQLLRKDRDLLRRFLFIMMYRNTIFAGRFEKARENYDSNDREKLLAYMDEKGFQRPRDVWFANIRAFLEADLTKESPDVLSDIIQGAYPMDATWFVMHLQSSFLAFCTPRNDADEFLLTQNVYSCFEGPSGADLYSDYHRFAPISPKIMIVLRSNLLPCADVEEDENTTSMKRFLELTNSMHLDPSTAGSWLEDLPVIRARNNYSQVVNGKVELLPTRVSRDKHIFHFPFISLDHEHVQKINMICLEQAARMKTIVYKSPDNLRTALEYYLTDKTPGFKQVYPPHPVDPKYLYMVLQEDGQIRPKTEDKMLPYLELLRKFARKLGSSVELKYNLMNPPQTVLNPAIVEQGARYMKLGGFS